MGSGMIGDGAGKKTEVAESLTRGHAGVADDNEGFGGCCSGSALALDLGSVVVGLVAGRGVLSLPQLLGS